MKAKSFFLFIVLVLSVASLSFAEKKIPSLFGKWKTESTGGMMLNAENQSEVTHWVPEQKVLKGRMEVTSQDGRFISGVYVSDRASEKFIGMITPDGKSFYASDKDGFWDCKIIDNDTFEIVYRHVKPTDSVVAIGMGKREK